MAAIEEWQKSNPTGFISKIKQKYVDFVLPVDYVLRSFGKHNPNSPTVKLADKILDHFQLESELFGYGNYKLRRAMKEEKKSLGTLGRITGYSDNKIADRLRDLSLVLDPELREGLVLSKESLDFIKRTDIKGSPERKALKQVQEMYDFNYNAEYR